MSTISTVIDKLRELEHVPEEQMEMKIHDIIVMLTDPTVLLIEWNELDVQQITREKLSFMEDCKVDEIIEEPLTKAQVAYVIDLLNSRYDCNYGITWDTIRCILDEVLLPDSESCRKVIEDLCLWTRELGTEDRYETECGNEYDYGTNEHENDMFKFCPYCGKKIKEAE